MDSPIGELNMPNILNKVRKGERENPIKYEAI